MASKTPPPNWHRLTARRLRKLSTQMTNLGLEMEYYGGFSPMADRGRELIGAARMARSWAREIEKSEPA